jgi:hypothetical protein
LVAAASPHYIYIADEFRRPEHERLKQDLPFFHPRLLDSAVLSGRADIYVQSFAIEEQWEYFRYKPTGLNIPTRLAVQAKIPCAELTKLPYEEVRAQTMLEFSEDAWLWFQKNFEYSGGFDAHRFARNLRDMFIRLRDKQVIIILSNTRHGSDSKGLAFNKSLNKIIEWGAVPYSPHFIRIDDLIHGPHEVADANHIKRPVFPRLAEALKAVIDGVQALETA